MVFWKEFFEKVDFEKKQANDKKHEKVPRMQTLNLLGWQIIKISNRKNHST